jgi:glycosyltransferase involved in cell wall biosynthesis
MINTIIESSAPGEGFHAAIEHRNFRNGFSEASVAQVIDSTDAGGAERTAIQLANALAAAGHSSHLIVTRHLGPLSEQIDPMVRLQVLNRQHTFEYGAIRRVIDYIRRWDIRILHAHNRTNAYWAVIWKHLGKLKTHVIFHDNTGDYACMPSWRVRLEEYLDRGILRSLDGIICASRPLQKRNARVLSPFRMPITSVHNGVDLAIYENTPRSPMMRRIVQVGNLRPQKGHLHIAPIGTHLTRLVGEFEWLCVGGLNANGYFSTLNRSLAENNLQNKVHFLGLRTDVHLLLAGAAVGVLTSDDEGMPLALLEYMAAGLPVVVTEVAECRQLVEAAQCGFVIPRGKHAEFAEAVAWLCNNPAQAERMGRQGREAVRDQYSVQKMKDHVENFYAKILSREPDLIMSNRS